jgi:D-3-phosphoglycerate dehydrogenase
MPRVLISDPIAREGIEKLREHAEVVTDTGLSPEQLLAIIPGFDALVVRSETKVTAGVIAAGARLKVIGRAGVGVDNIDVKAATAQGIVVVNSPHGNTMAAAELTIAMMLALARRIPQADASLRSGAWDRKRFVGTECFGKTLGIVGLGKIGAEVSLRARGLEMTVLAYDPYATDAAAEHCGARLTSLEEIYESADFITVHVPLNDKTRGLIGQAELARMRKGVRIINVARGGVVNEEALAEAIRTGHVAGAAFDVFSKEPVEPGHPLVGLAETVVTPHLGASTAEAQVKVAVDVAEQIVEVLDGQPARSAVNMPALSVEALQRAQPYMALGEKIGSLHTQLARDLDGRGRPISAVEVSYRGTFDGIALGAVTRSIVAGLLGPMLSDPVNLVNAPVLAAARGIRVTESATASHGEYSAMVSVRVTMPDGEQSICGVVVGRNALRIVHVDGYEVNLIPDGDMLFTRHTDQPGMIGAVGMLLGANRVNIGGMNVGREKVGGRALMVVMVDNPVTDEMLAKIRSLPGMETARVVRL